jgi:hypothetical protein
MNEDTVEMKNRSKEWSAAPVVGTESERDWMLHHRPKSSSSTSSTGEKSCQLKRKTGHGGALREKTGPGNPSAAEKETATEENPATGRRRRRTTARGEENRHTAARLREEKLPANPSATQQKSELGRALTREWNARKPNGSTGRK